MIHSLHKDIKDREILLSFIKTGIYTYITIHVYQVLLHQLVFITVTNYLIWGNWVVNKRILGSAFFIHSIYSDIENQKFLQQKAYPTKNNLK